MPGEAIEAKVTVFAEGSLGQLAEDVVKKKGLDRGSIPQIQSLGVKEVIKLPPESSFGANHVVHTFGFPLTDVFGGGTLYSLDKNTVAVALVLALDWKYADLNPQQELQVFKSHQYVRRILEGGEVIAYGAKTLPEGGYWALPRPYTDGALIVGDSAGFTDVRKLKGWHNAMRSGMLAAEAILAAVERDDFSAGSLKTYGDLLEASPVIADLKRGKNYRQMFTKGGSVYLGAPLSLIQGLFPGKMKTEPDYMGTEARPSQAGLPGGLRPAERRGALRDHPPRRRAVPHQALRTRRLRPVPPRLRRAPLRLLLPGRRLPVRGRRAHVQSLQLRPLPDLPDEVPAPGDPMARSRRRRRAQVQDHVTGRDRGRGHPGEAGTTEALAHRP